MKIFLKLKDWQLFILGVVCTFAFKVDNQTIYNTSGNIIRHVSFSPFEFLFFLFVYGWPLVVGISLYKMLPSDVKMNLIKLKISLLLPFILSFSMYLLRVIEVMGQKIILFGFSQRLIVGLVVGLIGHIYTGYFIAKELTAVELQRAITWNDYSNTFFLIWFSPVGVWWVQPRINRIFDDRNGDMNIAETVVPSSTDGSDEISDSSAF